MLHLVASLLLSQSGPLTVASSSPSGACIINSNGCVTDGPGSYGNNEQCTITTSVAVTLNSVGTFATESGYDYLTIGGTRYQGASGPSGVALPAGSSFTWTSDSSVANVGYVICATAAVAAGAPPQAAGAASRAAACDGACVSSHRPASTLRWCSEEAAPACDTSRSAVDASGCRVAL